MSLQIIIEPVKTEVSVSTTVTEVTANLALADAGAASVSITPTGSITATDLQGDTWYDIDDNIFYVRRTVDGVTDWVAVQTGENPDETDGGSF